MRITTKGRYALRAILKLAQESGTGPVSIKQLAVEEGISPEFLEQIFFRMKKTGILVSTRGPGGGFRLNKRSEEISLLDILEGAGENTDLTPCLNEGEDAFVCSRTDKCLAHNVWLDASIRMKNYFGNITLQSILENNGQIPRVKAG